MGSLFFKPPPVSFGRNHSKDITFLLRFLLPQRKIGRHLPLDFLFGLDFCCLFCSPIKRHLRQKGEYGIRFVVDLFWVSLCYSIFPSRWFCVWFRKPRSNLFSFKLKGCCPFCVCGLLTLRSWLRTSWKTRTRNLWSLLELDVLGCFGTRFQVLKPTNIRLAVFDSVIIRYGFQFLDVVTCGLFLYVFVLGESAGVLREHLRELQFIFIRSEENSGQNHDGWWIKNTCNEDRIGNLLW